MIGAVIVAFNPEKSDFKQVVNSVVNQVDELIIVNNGDTHIQSFKDLSNINIIENNENLGIANALNIGISYLISKNCDYFLLLDHDSTLPNLMVSTLVNELAVLNINSTKPVAVIGPAYFNTRLNKFAPFIKFGTFRNIKIPMPKSPRLIKVDFLISSGSLITREALDVVGLMDESLFIDFVDTEWCIRAEQKGYDLYAYSGVAMKHSLGDEPVNFFGSKLAMHSPTRHYYIVRNALFLIKNKSCALNTKFIIFKLFIRTLLFYSVIPKNRYEHFKKMMIGIKDGFKNKSGKINSF